MSYKWLVTAAVVHPCGFAFPLLKRILVETRAEVPGAARELAVRQLETQGYKTGDVAVRELHVDEEITEGGIPMDDVDSDLLDDILNAAERHGSESESEHQVGDLQAALTAAWVRMKPHQRRAAFEDVREQVESWQEE